MSRAEESEALGQRWRLGHLPGLNGLRGMAIILVMLCHTSIPALHGGGTVGVTVFFTLSGFLITALLIAEREDSGTVRMARFFERRARRLVPALLLFLAAMGIFGLVSANPLGPSGRDLLGALFYVSNYVGAMEGRDSVVLHTWTLAIEEQFYIVWPLLLVLVGRLLPGRRSLLLVAAGLTAYAVAARMLMWNGGEGAFRVTYGADTRMDALLVGCMVALMLRRPACSVWWHRVSPMALGVLVVLMFVGGSAEYLVVTTVAPWLTAIVLVSLAYGGTVWLATAWLALLGRRSYGIYLWHFPLFGLAVAAPAGNKIAAWAVVLSLTAAIAHLSWRCVELPFLTPRQAKVLDEDGVGRGSDASGTDRGAARRVSVTEAT